MDWLLSLSPFVAFALLLVAFYVHHFKTHSIAGITVSNFLITHSKDTLDNSTPLLLAYYTSGNDLLHVQSGEIDAMSYRIYATTIATQKSPNSAIEPQMDSGAVIYVFELDFNTQAHIIGLGNQAKLEQMRIRTNLRTYKMERIDLEGNFHDYFDLYAPVGQQLQARYIFDPEAMQAYMSYCQNNFWEIVGDEMYVVIGANHDESSYVVGKAKEFIDEIRPAFTPSSAPSNFAPVFHEAPYGQLASNLNCPICQKQLQHEYTIAYCPVNHGVLMHGREFVKLRKGELQFSIDTPVTVPHGILTCPNCKNNMVTGQYIGTDIKIDSCTKCAYRWIDANEVAILQNDVIR